MKSAVKVEFYNREDGRGVHHVRYFATEALAREAMASWCSESGFSNMYLINIEETEADAKPKTPF